MIVQQTGLTKLTGPLAISYGTGFIPNLTGPSVRKFQPVVSPLNFLTGPNQQAFGLAGQPNLFSIINWDLTCHSRGSINTTSSSLAKSPEVKFNYLSDTDGPSGTSIDLANVVEAYLDLYNIICQMSINNPGAGLQIVYPPIATDPGIFTASAFPTFATLGTVNATKVAKYFKINPSLPQHYAGTVSMNSNSALGVVDGNLKVHGVKGKSLYVADNSIFPITPDCNPSFSDYVTGLVLSNYLLMLVMRITLFPGGAPDPPLCRALVRNTVSQL